MRLFRQKSKEDNTSQPKHVKRKAPPKPWGKVERTLIFLLLFATAIVSMILALSARSWKLPGLPQLALPNLSLEKTFILEDSPLQDQQFAFIQADFQTQTKNLSGVWGLYVIRLYKDVSYGVQQDQTFQAASLIKLPVLLALYMESEKGNIALDASYELKSEDKVGGAGSLYYKPAGTKVTFRKLAELMGQESDNTAYNILKNKLGEEVITNAFIDAGMYNTSLEANETTPEDIGNFFRTLMETDLVGEESRQEILAFLTDTLYESWLRAGIPEDIQVAHKFGREVHVVNDAGIVFADKPFVVVIMSKGIIEEEADAVFPELAKLIYEFESK